MPPCAAMHAAATVELGEKGWTWPIKADRAVPWPARLLLALVSQAVQSQGSRVLSQMWPLPSWGLQGESQHKASTKGWLRAKARPRLTGVSVPTNSCCLSGGHYTWMVDERQVYLSMAPVAGWVKAPQGRGTCMEKQGNHHERVKAVV